MVLFHRLARESYFTAAVHEAVPCCDVLTIVRGVHYHLLQSTYIQVDRLCRASHPALQVKSFCSKSSSVRCCCPARNNPKTLSVRLCALVPSSLLPLLCRTSHKTNRANAKPSPAAYEILRLATKLCVKTCGFASRADLRETPPQEVLGETHKLVSPLSFETLPASPWIRPEGVAFDGTSLRHVFLLLWCRPWLLK